MPLLSCPRWQPQNCNAVASSASTSAEAAPEDSHDTLAVLTQHHAFAPFVSLADTSPALASRDSSSTVSLSPISSESQHYRNCRFDTAFETSALACTLALPVQTLTRRPSGKPGGMLGRGRVERKRGIVGQWPGLARAHSDNSRYRYLLRLPGLTAARHFPCVACCLLLIAY